MRIITGRAKGLRLKSPTGSMTRPTSDRIKESLFSVLTGLINFAEVNAVLDVFAGTGALGIESLSRGAMSATFIDSATTNLIAENVRRAKFSAESAILHGDYATSLRKLSRQAKQFELIFSDPPYNKGLSQASVNLIAKLNLPATNGLLIIEHGTNENLSDIPENLVSVRSLVYGHTTAIDILTFKRSVL